MGKKDWLGRYFVMADQGKKKTDLNPIEYTKTMEQCGAGEILVNSVNRDGTMEGYEIELLKQIARAVSVPVIGCGGAGDLTHMAQAVHEAGVSAVAAGSLFVFKGKHRAVLINYPSRAQLKTILAN